MKLKELRENNNLKPEDVAKLLNISIQMYYRKEKGVNKVSMDQLIKLADFYNVTIDYILDRKYHNEINYLSEKQKELLPFIETLNKDKVMQAKGYLERLNQENSKSSYNIITKITKQHLQKMALLCQNK